MGVSHTQGRSGALPGAGPGPSKAGLDLKTGRDGQSARKLRGYSMRTAVIAGVLGALLPTLAMAQTKVALGDGVSVVFPSAPVKMHTTVDSAPGVTPPRRAPGAPPLPVPPN